MAEHDWLKTLENLGPDKSHGDIAPHKPVLLLAVLDLVEEGLAKTPQVELGPTLIECFGKYRDLISFGIPNDFQSTKRISFGPWYGDGENDPGRRSCRHLVDAITEFRAQGLELDAVLLTWGTDLLREAGKWSNAKARNYKKGAHVKNPFQLRLNAYRVLLTRGRDATMVFVPPIPELEETRRYLIDSGFRCLV